MKKKNVPDVSRAVRCVSRRQTDTVVLRQQKKRGGAQLPVGH